MRKVVRKVLKQYRTVAGENTSIESAARRTYSAVIRNGRRVRMRWANPYLIGNAAMVWGNDRTGQSTGMFLKGSCDLAAMFSIIPDIKAAYPGTCGILREGLVSDARADMVLQTLTETDPAARALFKSKFGLRDDYFQTSLFLPEFSIRGPRGRETF